MFIPFDQLQRQLRHPYPLRYCGITHNNPTPYGTRHYGELSEFCFRMSATEKTALDTLNGKTFRSGYPHFILKRGGWTHGMGTDGVRSGFVSDMPRRQCAEWRNPA